LPLGAERLLEGGQQLIEPNGESADLVTSAPADSLAQVAGVDDPFGRLGESAQRGRGPTRDQCGEDRSGPDPPERDENEQPPQTRKVSIDLEQRPRDTDVRVLRDQGEHARPHTLERLGGERRPRLRGGCPRRASIDLNLNVRRGAR
jgi:hypothetical protein